MSFTPIITPQGTVPNNLGWYVNNQASHEKLVPLDSFKYLWVQDQYDKFDNQVPFLECTADKISVPPNDFDRKQHE